MDLSQPAGRRAHAWPALLLALSVGGCASSAETVRQDVTVLIEIHNDVAPSTDGIVYLYPVWGARDERIELGVVRGGESGSFRVTVPAERYTLGARPLFSSAADRYQPPIPNAQTRSPFRRTDRFSVTPDTRRVVWTTRARVVTVDEEGDPSGP